MNTSLKKLLEWLTCTPGLAIYNNRSSFHIANIIELSDFITMLDEVSTECNLYSYSVKTIQSRAVSEFTNNIEALKKKGSDITSVVDDPDNKFTLDIFLKIINNDHNTKKSANILSNYVYVDEETYMENVDKLSQFYSKFKRKNPKLKSESVQLLHEITNTNTSAPNSILNRLKDHETSKSFSLLGKAYTVEHLRTYPFAFDWVSIIAGKKSSVYLSSIANPQEVHDKIEAELSKENKTISDLILEVDTNIVARSDSVRIREFRRNILNSILGESYYLRELNYDLIDMLPAELIERMIESISEVDTVPNFESLKGSGQYNVFKGLTNLEIFSGGNMINFSRILSFLLYGIDRCSDEAFERRHQTALKFATLSVKVFNNLTAVENLDVTEGLEDITDLFNMIKTKKIKVESTDCSIITGLDIKDIKRNDYGIEYRNNGIPMIKRDCREIKKILLKK